MTNFLSIAKSQSESKPESGSRTLPLRRTGLRPLIAAALLACALPAVAEAQGQILPQNISPDLRYADTCFNRSYSASHLQQRPRQQVTRIALAALDRGADRPNMPANQSEFLIAAQVRGSSQWKTGLAYCTFGAGETSACAIEGDGGQFSLTNRPDGTVLIRTQGELRLGEDERMAEFGGQFSDDNAFILSGIGCRRANSR